MTDTRQPEPGEWRQDLARAYGLRILAVRTGRGMSAQDVADRTAALGHPVARSVIAETENGRRKVVEVAEWLVIAAALDVPPASLIFPTDVETVTALPGIDANPWSALDWLIGRRTSPAKGLQPTYGTVEMVREAWDDAHAAREDAVSNYGDAARRAATDDNPVLLELKNERRARLDEIDAHIRSLEQRFRESGFAVPEPYNPPYVA